MYKFGSRIRYSEVGPDGRLTMESLINYFQDCSTFQSEDLGIGIGYMKEKQIMWIVNFWQIDVFRYPCLGEKIRTGTLPYSIKSFIGLRNFMMETEEGELLAVANSVWSLIDTANGVPMRVPQEIMDKYGTEEKLDMEYLPRKIRLPGTDGAPRPEITIQEHHLDTNRHVNNGQFVRLALMEMPDTRRVKRLLVEYRKQAFLGDVMYPLAYEEGNTITVSLNAADGSPYAVVRAETE